MFGLGIGEISLLLIIILLLFGGKKLPELGKSLGKAITNFKGSLNEKDEKDKIENKKEDE